MTIKHLICSVYFGIGLLASSGFAHAQMIATFQPLKFGTIAIRNLTDMTEITVNGNGTFTTNANTFLIEDPQRGEYHITGAPVSTAYSVTFPASVSLTGAGGNFTLDNFTTFPAILTTSAIGEATFFIGARNRSTGGVTYGDGAYNDTFNITVNY
ncbi:MAG: DUF4402 domain-containing protein [Alphaproteobacteria bacterium]|nr:DUF4402 domain-containing protein [Alphaproteobacteria bacterium]